MSTTRENLNLARKWRPKTFDDIVGQEISVRMLKNGLYLKKFFPVYLFAGQRGCGKTSTARVFASAINCQNLENFQNNPTSNKLPCLECESCKSMLQANHPDFIEIDAASHTGVENVRQILESCTYKPIFGQKKIYLIDEAHMLSKAAFNAFLKVLEEPPSSALFILATTEIQKFPETVLSRCFQITFKSIANNNLKDHLLQICKNEEIEIDEKVLDILIQETEGSARDAINLLERVRFSQKKVTVDSLLQVLGKISETELFKLFDILLSQEPTKLLEHLNSQTFQNVDPQTIWNMLVQLCRALVWLKFKAEKCPTYFNDTKTLKILAEKCSLNRLNAIMQLLWSQENLFLRTPQKNIFLETVLLQICQQVNIEDLEKLLQYCKTENNNIDPQTNHRPQVPIANSTEKSAQNPITMTQKEGWPLFLEKISQINDPLLISILSQTEFKGKNEETKLISISLSNNSGFFKEKITDSTNLWKPHFTQAFPGFSGFEFIQKPTNFAQKPQKIEPATSSQSGLLDVSNKEMWPKANLILQHFPGKLRKTSE